ncbi:hypothetical protein SPSINT_0484 [Staphylococcus pseudintermedius HKU10-03]|nr:hypothetical protein SPSINT_0484 [Staphylococcus pseudintermedius HKU10-03]ADX77210.1 hypothetical protein SPSE_1964 [Staphylococcus pseudintermedius ED99]
MTYKNDPCKKLFIFTLTVIHFLIDELANYTINNETNEHINNSFHFDSPLHLS